MPTSRRRWAFRLLSPLLALVLFFAVGELAVRAFGLAPSIIPLSVETEWGQFVSSDNPKLRYVPRPGTGEINSYGIRDRLFPEEKPAGTFRIVVIGDSFGFGLWVRDVADTFPKVLEAELRDAGLPDIETIEVINLSVSGYDTEQEVEFLRTKGLVFDPDLIVVSFCLNDYQDVSWELLQFTGQEAWSTNQAILDAVGKNAVYRSHLVRVTLARAPVMAERVARWSGYGEPETETTDRVHRGFTELAELSRKHGFDVLVAIWPDLMDFENYRHHGVHEATLAHTRAAGFHHLDMFPSFVDATGGKAAGIRHDDGHPNAVAHAIAARTIATYLRAEMLR